MDNKLVDFILEYLDDCNGKKLGIDHTGMMGSLTLNLGVISYIYPDSNLINNLHTAYVNVTGDTINKPQAIGGGDLC